LAAPRALIRAPALSSQNRPALSPAHGRCPQAQTRRRFGGRHPLCGIGVTSRIEVIRKPTD
jgi:hypothetical protein